MIEPTSQDVLRAVITTIEDEIAPGADEYVASLCRTAAQMLRSVAARHRDEITALTADTADLRAVLVQAAGDTPDLTDAIAAAVAEAPIPVHPALPELQSDARRLRALLVDVVQRAPEDSQAREAARAYVGRQLRRELSWQQNAYTGPRR